MRLACRRAWDQDLQVGDVGDTAGRHVRGRCRAGHQVPLDAFGVQSVCEHDAEQQDSHEQHTRQQPRRRTGPHHVWGPPRRHHAAMLAACGPSPTSPSGNSAVTRHVHGRFTSASTPRGEQPARGSDEHTAHDDPRAGRAGFPLLRKHGFLRRSVGGVYQSPWQTVGRPGSGRGRAFRTRRPAQQKPSGPLLGPKAWREASAAIGEIPETSSSQREGSPGNKRFLACPLMDSELYTQSDTVDAQSVAPTVGGSRCVGAAVNGFLAARGGLRPDARGHARRRVQPSRAAGRAQPAMTQMALHADCL